MPGKYRKVFVFNLFELQCLDEHIVPFSFVA